MLFRSKHLLDCSSCRTSAQDGKALSRWFVKPQRLEFASPAGFSARVARRAFAGDVGSATGADPLIAAGAGGADERGRVFQFVLWTTVIAAAVMLIAAVALREQRLPTAGRLGASPASATADQVLRKLDELNRIERKAQPAATVPPAGAPGR